MEYKINTYETISKEDNKELTLLSEEISKTPEDAELLEKRAIYFLNNNNLESALMDYKECVKLSADNSNYHYQLAYLYVYQAGGASHN